MEVKPIPKPRLRVAPEVRSTATIPVPAPRKRQVVPEQVSIRSSSPSESSASEKSDEGKGGASPESKGSTPEFLRSLGNSSRNFKDEISEKMTLKGKAVISSTRNASLRLERSMKNLLTRRLTSVNSDDAVATETMTVDGFDDKGGKEDPGRSQDRCVSMPTDDIFNRISFYSPLRNNLRSVKNEEDLSTTARYSPPPPVYPPPPLPEESIYDELQSVTSGHSSRYGTLSSTISDRIEPEFRNSFDLLSFAQNRTSTDSERSFGENGDSLGPDKLGEVPKNLSRSDSWTFYDAAPPAKSGVDLEAMSSLEEEANEAPIEESLLRNSAGSRVSVENSIYDNWIPKKPKSPGEILEVSSTSAPSTPVTTSREISKSLLFEFDPLSRTEENVYSNYENNDLMLLEAYLATSASPSSAGSLADLREAEEVVEEDRARETATSFEEEPEAREEPGVPPPAPPRRFDSLPKNEYDEVAADPPELIEGRHQIPKSPAVLPKLSQIKRKQPALPPRKPSTLIHVEKREPKGSDNPEEALPPSPQVAEENRTSMMRKLQRKLRHDSVTSIKPNVINFVRGNKLLSRNRDAQKDTNAKKLERPRFQGDGCVATHRGIVYRPGAGMERTKDLVSRAAVLADNKLCFYTDKTMTTPKESVLLETVHSVHLLQDVKIVDGESVHCIAVSGEGRPGVYVFYVKGIAERRIWAQRILEALTPVFPVKYTSDLTRAGWAYVKEGVTGAWFPAWLLLQRRNLFYTRSTDSVVFELLDLRKARCIVLREQEGPNAGTGNVPVVVVDAGGRGALHIAGPGSRESPVWKHALYQGATNCGAKIDQQQLTQDNVPVILDKCINFIYAHGIMSEGIYRRSGSSSAVAKLLEMFRTDAWATQITRSVYSEHDVATVLRRFLRDLPEPLLPASIHDPLCRIVEMSNVADRVKAYRAHLNTLEAVGAATLRRILAHLHCLSQQSNRNRMTPENLSAVWGPTLMHAGETNAEDWNRSETKVVGDLIQQYPKLYQLSATDLAREAKMLEVLELHHVSNNRPRGAPSGDLKIWIYIMEREGECVNVTIGPQKTAFDVCRELSEKTKYQAHELCLEESALGGDLERPLHHNERVLETVARWGYWDMEDRKNNVLVLKEDKIYKDIIPLVKPPMTMSSELKFADLKSKHFKSYLFEFSQAKLCCYKDKMCATKLHEWKIEDIVWYIGHESKRNPQMGWSITFVVKSNKPNRCKETPFFGYTLAGALKGEEYRWLAAMLFGEYQLNLRPSSVNLMDA